MLSLTHVEVELGCDNKCFITELCTIHYQEKVSNTDLRYYDLSAKYDINIERWDLIRGRYEDNQSPINF